MRTDSVITIVGAHDARDAASRLGKPVPDGSCRAGILAWRRRWRDECQRLRGRRPPCSGPAWRCRWSSRHRTAARTPQAVQLGCTRRCRPQGQRDSGRPGPRLPAADAGATGRRL